MNISVASGSEPSCNVWIRYAWYSAVNKGPSDATRPAPNSITALSITPPVRLSSMAPRSIGPLLESYDGLFQSPSPSTTFGKNLARRQAKRVGICRSLVTPTVAVPSMLPAVTQQEQTA